MARNISARTLMHDGFLIVFGSAIYALGVDCFQIPFDIAAGGITGLATVIHAAALPAGLDLPIGILTIAMNLLLLIPVFKTGGTKYAARTIAGILASGFWLDVLSPFVPQLAGYDLLMAVIWGGVISGIGLGLVFRSGGNTGGTDIIAQIIAKKLGMQVGLWSIFCDGVVVLIAIPVFGYRNALYAIICMVIMGRVVDAVIDGPRTERACYIISEEHEKIANEIMYELGRGCTEIQARGVWSGQPHPMLFVILGRTEIGFMKNIVADIDPSAVVVISEVHEAFGEGFKKIDAGN